MPAAAVREIYGNSSLINNDPYLLRTEEWTRESIDFICIQHSLMAIKILSVQFECSKLAAARAGAGGPEWGL